MNSGSFVLSNFFNGVVFCFLFGSLLISEELELDVMDNLANCCSFSLVVIEDHLAIDTSR